MLKPSARRLLKRLRYSQPFNWTATTLARALLGQRSELAIRHVHRVGSVRSRLPNGRLLRLWSRADDWVSNQVFWRGWSGYEPETAPLFFRLASRARVTLDVGAYVGFYTLLAAHANPSGHVYAFEPLPTAFERLRGNIARNRLGNVDCVPSAVGAIEGTVDFYFAGADGIPCSSSASREFMRDVAGLTSARVPMLTLDGFLATRRIGAVDLVKIDTESTEPDVLRGAIDMLKRHSPWIVCEVLPGRGAEAPLAEILGPLGYRFYHLTPAGPEERQEPRGHPTWLNYLFTPRPLEDVERLA